MKAIEGSASMASAPDAMDRIEELSEELVRRVGEARRSLKEEKEKMKLEFEALETSYMMAKEFMYSFTVLHKVYVLYDVISI